MRSEVGETWYGNVMWATTAGSRVLGDQLRVPLSAGGFPGHAALHRLAVTDLGFRMHLGGEVTITEREVRALEGSGQARSHLDLLQVPRHDGVMDGRNVERFLATTVGKDATLHYPDLVHVSPGRGKRGLNAVEVEITPKTPHRARQVLMSYRDSQLYDRVLFYVTAQVSAQLQGWYDAEGKWRDGLLQQIGEYPSGVDPTEFLKTSTSMFRVYPATANDDGVAFRLDMRQVSEADWVSKNEWLDLRAKWQEWVADQGTRVPFLTWWMDVYKPLLVAQRATR